MPITSQTEAPFITFENVSFAYTDEVILADLSFTIPVGDYVGLLGPNGSGKTTLMKLMLGLLEPMSGSVKVFGKPVRKFHDWSTIGYVPQKTLQIGMQFPATVEEVVRSGITPEKGLFAAWGQEDQQRVEEAMEEANIVQLRDRRISKLSGGQRQRVFIARALAANPKVLILDEPTVGVDAGAQGAFYSLLQKLHKERGITIVFVSHDIDVITHEADTILCVNKELVCHTSSKQFVEEGHLKELFADQGYYTPHSH